MSLIDMITKSKEKRVLKRYEENLGYITGKDYRDYGYNYRDLESRKMAMLEEKIRIRNGSCGVLAPMFSEDEREW